MQLRQKLTVVLLPGNDVHPRVNTTPASTNTPSGSTTSTSSTVTPGSRTTPPADTTSDENFPNLLPEVVVTGKRMANGETREATADDGIKVKITKVADGQYTVADASGKIIKQGGTNVLEGYGFDNLTQ